MPPMVHWRGHTFPAVPMGVVLRHMHVFVRQPGHNCLASQLAATVV